MSHSYHIFGGPGSPYSHKIRAVFRYRRLPHLWTIPQGEFKGQGDLGSDNAASSDLARANKSVIPVVKYPDGSYKADTTPIIYDLEKRHAGRSVIPPHAGLAFLAHLIEDLADEFLPIPMFHYRWTDDQVWCSKRQMIGWSGAIDDKELDVAADAFLARQVEQLGKGADNRERMEAAYQQFYATMETQLKHNMFLFGSRPSIAEFALYGQLTQYYVDPTLSTRMKETAIRTYQWTHFVDDLSGLEGVWFDPEPILEGPLQGFLQLVAAFYLPMAELLVDIAGLDDLQESANGMKYRVKTFLDLKRELHSLSEQDRRVIKPILEQTGCWNGLQFKEGEQEKVVPVLPL
ncbi:MAG: hypothetical protein GY866_23255 [Proteobacteria bacterium]|nr:hypothetical protein [Pseudomonadota bacterium]